jgi:2,7-dihydroxy-5-methyl-1-naphthoate 7-O-methyltransferase
MSPGLDLAAQAARLRRAADVAPSRALYALCVLRVPDQLREGPRTAAELARSTGAAADPLARVLRAAAELDVVEQRGPDHWALRPAGRLLCTCEPGSLQAELADNDLFTAWVGFEDTVRTGKPCYPLAFGVPIFDRLTSHQADRERFHQHMHARARILYAPLLDLDVWPDSGTVVDVCGGTGGLLAALLAARPGVAGVLHDLPEVLALSPLSDTPEGSRVTFVPGDVFDAVPADGDLYVLASVLHDWSDEQAAAILARCRTVMRPGARLFLLERVLPESGSCPAVFADLLMLAMTGGRERTREHWRRLLAGSDLQLSGVHAVDDSEISLLSCIAEPAPCGYAGHVPLTSDPKEGEH